MKLKMQKDITVIVILFNTPFKKIINLKQYKNFNLIIFEQGTQQSSIREIKKILDFKFNYFYSKKNLGLSKGMNFLIKKTKTKYCFITEPDISINEKSIINLKKTIKLNNNLLLVGPSYKKKKTKKNFQITKQIDLSCVLFETKKMRKFNLYDEDFFFFWTDTDLVKRVNESNYKMAISKNSFALHKMSTSSNNKISINLLREKSYKYGELIFDYKHGSLRALKIVRQLFQSFLKTLFFLIILDKKNFSINCGYIFGILNFLIYLLKKKLKFFPNFF